MQIAFNTSQVVLPVLYTILLFAYGRLFTRGPGGLALYVRPLLAGTILLHLLAVTIHSLMIGSCPLWTGASILSLTALSLSAVYLVLELRTGERSVGVFAMTMALALQFIATVSALGSAAPAELKMGFRGSFHVFGAIVGFSGMLLSNVFGVLYLSLYGVIKRGDFKLFYRKMPPLETLSDLNLVATWVAFLALTVSVGLGFWGYFAAGEAPFPVADPSIVLTFILWLLLGGCLFSQRFLSLGRKRLAYATLFGFLLLVGIFVGELATKRFHG
ncbi:MAG: cytochrome c biogenesis protein CcsA [Planctomycetes bacterium]|nr:cytochrome c biogenesis protein CcsA [Planctomycetota bacterium]